MNKEYKKIELNRLEGYLKNGYLKGVETGYISGSRKGKRVTNIEMTFKVQVKGVVLPDCSEDEDE